VFYRLYDVGYEIDLERAAELLVASAPERRRLSRGGAEAIQIRNLPLTVSLGATTIHIGDRPAEIELSARIFDFGVVSLRARLDPPQDLPWRDYVSFGIAASTAPVWSSCFLETRDRLLAELAPAIVRPEVSAATEDYVVFRVNRLADDLGAPVSPERLPDEDIAALLLAEPRSLAPSARKELLSPRFSYLEDDLTVLTWNAALIVEPDVEDTDAQYVLEFANAQLLELRYYDSVLDGELPRIYSGIAAARRGFHLLGRRYSRLLVVLHSRVTDATELVERVENSLRVTDDVFLARVYAAALEIFRSRVWRTGIDRKVAIVRDAYTMLNAESQARRAEVLELIIVALIAIEIVLSLLRP
jgi:hypothetical protein